MGNIKININRKKPIISCYPEYGFLFSLQEDLCNPWIINNMIQIRLIPEWENFLSFSNHEDILTNCPFLKYQQLSYEEVSKNDIIQFIVDTIDGGDCLYVYVDRFYISQLSEYLKYHYIHRMFVVGYDLEEQSLYIADNFTNGQFEIIKCHFEHFKRAFYRDESIVINNKILQDDYDKNVVQYTMDVIDKNKSAMIFAERYDIKEYNSQHHISHEMEVVGYDKEKQEFYIDNAGADDITCTFEELKKAYRIDPKQDYINDVVIIGLNDAYEEQDINISQIIDGLSEYMESQSLTTYSEQCTCMYGICAIEHLIENAEKYNEFRIRAFQFLYEHKLLMEIRVKCLIDNGIISEQDICIEKFTKLHKMLLLIRNKIIKAFMEKEICDMGYIKTIFDEFIELDKQCCKELLQVLKNSEINKRGN